ncbi:hypothetical protein BGW42_005189 [Actinomortierella wolfii]|nr:hypothetical protein BGW42_005189 [Actinomortierella wolfii]
MASVETHPGTEHPSTSPTDSLATVLSHLEIQERAKDSTIRKKDHPATADDSTFMDTLVSSAETTNNGHNEKSTTNGQQTPFHITELVDMILSYLPPEEVWKCALINATFFEVVRRRPLGRIALHTRPAENLQEFFPRLIHLTTWLTLQVQYIEYPKDSKNTMDRQACEPPIPPQFPHAASTAKIVTRTTASTLPPPPPPPPPPVFTKYIVAPNNVRNSTGSDEDEEPVIGILCRSRTILEVKLSTFCGWLSKASKALTLELTWLSNDERGDEVMRKIIHALPNVVTLYLNIRRINAMYQFVDSIRGKTTLRHLRLYADGLWDPNLYKDRRFSRYWPSQDERAPEYCYIETIYVHKPIPFSDDNWLELFSHFGHLTDIHITLPQNIIHNFGETLIQHCPYLVGWTGSQFGLNNLGTMRPVLERLLRFRPKELHSSNWAVETLQKSFMRIEELHISSYATALNLQGRRPMTSNTFQAFLESPAARSLRKLKWFASIFDGLQAEDVYHGITPPSKGWTCLEMRELQIQIKHFPPMAPDTPPLLDSNSHQVSEDDQRRLIVLQGFYRQLARLEHLEYLSLRGYIDVENMQETGLHQLAQLRKIKELELHVWPTLTVDFLKWVLSTWPETLEYLQLDHRSGRFVCRKEGVLPNTEDYVRVVLDDDGPEPEWYERIGRQSMFGLLPARNK